jgi:orotate phosphoribosyltransferase
MERGTGSASAVDEVRATFGIPVTAIATLDDVMAFIDDRAELKQWKGAVSDYRAKYGAAKA